MGRRRVQEYVAKATDLGTPVAATELYVACLAYEHHTDPERFAARELRTSVTAVRTIRRRWGIRRNNKKKVSND